MVSNINPYINKNIKAYQIEKITLTVTNVPIKHFLQLLSLPGILTRSNRELINLVAAIEATRVRKVIL